MLLHIFTWITSHSHNIPNKYYISNRNAHENFDAIVRKCLKKLKTSRLKSLKTRVRHILPITAKDAIWSWHHENFSSFKVFCHAILWD